MCLHMCLTVCLHPENTSQLGVGIKSWLQIRAGSKTLITKGVIEKIKFLLCLSAREQVDGGALFGLDDAV